MTGQTCQCRVYRGGNWCSNQLCWTVESWDGEHGCKLCFYLNLFFISFTTQPRVFIIQFGFSSALFSKTQHLVCEEMLLTLRSLSDVWKEANFWEAIYVVVPHEYPMEFCHWQIKGRASRLRRMLDMKGGYDVRRERAAGITRQEHACFV